MWKFVKNNLVLRSITVFVATIVFSCVFLVILFPILTLLLLWRRIIGWTAKCFKKGKLGKMVASTSTYFGSADVYTRKAVTMVVAFEVESSTLSIEKMRTMVEEELLSARIPNTNEILYPEFTSTLTSWMGYLFWLPCRDFNIKNHVLFLEETDAPTYDPGDPTWITRVTAYLTRNRVWVKNKPLWEIILVENITRQTDSTLNKSVIILRAHHAIGDGWSFFKAINKVFGNPDEVKNVPTPRLNKQQITTFPLWTRFWFWIKLPFEMMDHVLTVLSDRTEIPPLELSPIWDDHDVSGIMDKVFPLERLKRIKTTLGVDFHSLIVAGIASAIRQAQLRTGKKVPEHVKIAYPVPMPGHPDKLRNHVSLGFILLPIGEPDPMKRVKSISTRVQSGIRAGLPIPMFLIFRLMGSMPLVIVHRLKTKAKVPPIMFTNIVGPSAPCYWEGKRILDIKFSTNIPCDEPGRYAYGVGIFTYCGRTNFGVGGLRHYFPDMTHPQQFIQRCIAEWEELELLADLNDSNVSVTQIV